MDRWVAEKSPKAWKRVEIRESTKGKLLVDILHKEIWVWDGKKSCVRKWHLVVRREINSPEKIKYNLRNAPSNTPIKRLAFMQTRGYCEKRPFQDAKNQCGRREYQARGWIAWHHHLSMVMLAMSFMLEQRLNNRAGIPLLSCADITTLLKSVLPRRDITENEILRQLEVRH